MSTTNADRLQHRWTRQLLCRSALLPRPSTLKLTNLLLASGASLLLALRAQPPLSYTVRSPWWNGSARTKSASTEPLDISRSKGWGGGRNRGRKWRIPHISPPLRFVLRLRLQKGGRICGTLRHLFYFIFIIIINHNFFVGYSGVLPYQSHRCTGGCLERDSANAGRTLVANADDPFWPLL